MAELVKAAHGKGEFCMKIERRGGEAAMGAGELGGEGELEAELGLARAAFGYQLRYRVAGNAATKATVDYGAAHGALFGR